eukprot:20009-Heterococcus_DN1.PRE.2
MWKHWPVASRYSELLQQFKLVLVSGLPHATSDSNSTNSTNSSSSSTGDSYAVWCDAVQSLRSFGLPWAQRPQHFATQRMRMSCKSSAAIIHVRSAYWLLTQAARKLQLPLIAAFGLLLLLCVQYRAYYAAHQQTLVLLPSVVLSSLPTS